MKLILQRTYEKNKDKTECKITQFSVQHVQQNGRDGRQPGEKKISFDLGILGMECSSKHDIESAKFGELTLLAELEFKKSSSDHLEEPVAFSDKPLEKTRQEDKKIKRERIGKRRKGQLRCVMGGG
ncbi:hypothetical protein NC652_037579 [Populus alba x Populus x berolinensis]|nr:hypothetical protein NC652_037579 [Populus alba x Populus x berolinensis]